MFSSVCQKWPSDRSGSAGNRGDCSVSYTTRWDTILETEQQGSEIKIGIIWFAVFDKQPDLDKSVP